VAEQELAEEELAGLARAEALQEEAVRLGLLESG